MQSGSMDGSGSGTVGSATSAGEQGGQGGEGIGGNEETREGGDIDESDRDGAKVVKLPDDIPVDGSGDDVVGRQIREAAIAMQETNPAAAEKLWDEYRKHTGIK
jgi:hypothetical protein